MDMFGHGARSEESLDSADGNHGQAGEPTTLRAVAVEPPLALARRSESIEVSTPPFEDELASGLTRSLARGELSNVIRLAAETADRMERDAQEFVRKQVSKLQTEVREARLELARDRDAIERLRDQAERERLDIISGARAESARIISDAQSRGEQKTRDADATSAQIIADAQARADEIARQAMQEARELREWAQGQSREIIERAQAGAEMLLQAAGRGQIAVDTVTEIVSQAMRTPVAEQHHS